MNRKLPKDLVRTVVAAITAAFMLGAWVFVFASAEMRAGLADQEFGWWITRALLPTAFGLACVGVSFGVAAARWPALVLAALNLLLDALTFGTDLKDGHFSFPLTGILCGLLIWRLLDARAVAASGTAPGPGNRSE